MGLEPTPGPWQGPVLPLYYGRPNQRNSNTSSFWRQDPQSGEIQRLCTSAEGTAPGPSQVPLCARADNAISQPAELARFSQQETFAAAQQIW